MGAKRGQRLLRRRRWSNSTGNQAIDPISVEPTRGVSDVEAQLAELIDRARREHLTIRAVGSGHSWSDCALTTGYLVRPEGMSWARLLDSALVTPETPIDRLVEVGAGTRIAEINAFLDRNGLGLIQMGGYDGQTIAGVISTSTHGSGIGFPPFPDYVRSIDLIDGLGRRRRIEPSDGITDAERFATERDGWLLEQDDDWFCAAACGIGCMGIILSCVLEVRDSFRLTERRELKTWAEIKELLEAEAYRDVAHWEFYVNTISRNGKDKNTCILTTRVPDRNEAGPHHRPLLPEFLGHLPSLTLIPMRLAGWLAPQLIPTLLEFSLRQVECKRYNNVSFKVYNVGSVNNLRAYSAEMEVPVEHAVQAVETVLAIAELYAQRGSIYHTAPVAFRFVAPSRALMSMMHGGERMTIELIHLIDTVGGIEIIHAHEEALAKLGVRPHWGQVNALERTEVAARYPGLRKWEAIRAQLDPEGVFESPFSKRVGLTSRGFQSG
ncbi:MAG: D-arabinono-1,4-lactone oxidase [Solirubrobacteraceae bacterium]